MSNEFNPGVPPTDKEKPTSYDFVLEVSGLEEAIDATRNKISEYNKDGSDVSELEFHLKRLEERLKTVMEKKNKAA